jgi:hypothetical protein
LAAWIAGRLAGAVGAAVAVACLIAVQATIVGAKLGPVPATLVLIGGFWVLSPWAAAGAVLIWVVPGAIRGNPLAGASLAAAAFPLGLWLLAHPGPVVLVLAVVAAGLAVWMQRTWWKEFGL